MNPPSIFTASWAIRTRGRCFFAPLDTRSRRNCFSPKNCIREARFCIEEDLERPLSPQRAAGVPGPHLFGIWTVLPRRLPPGLPGGGGTGGRPKRPGACPGVCGHPQREQLFLHRPLLGGRPRADAADPGHLPMGALPPGGGGGRRLRSAL